jgi:hypothetical protein
MNPTTYFLFGPELFQSAHMAHALKIYSYTQTYFEDSFELAHIISPDSGIRQVRKSQYETLKLSAKC